MFSPTARALTTSLLTGKQPYGLPTQDAMAQVARMQPNDATLQFAAAMEGNTPDILKRLPPLEQRFPRDARLIAAELRCWTNGTGPGHAVRVGHEAEMMVLEPREKRLQKQTIAPASVPDAEMLKRYDTLAAQGEALEPQNAYFPAMRAIGYWNAGREAEALAAWRRSGEKSEWNDHTIDEITAKWDLLLRINGGSEVGFLPRTASAFSILFPHYAQVRAAARLAAVRAIQAEQSGDRESGFALRQATRRIGQSMEISGHSYIGNLVGIAILELAASRPDGVEPIVWKTPVSEEEQKKTRQVRRGAYTDYLRKIGHADEATAFTRATEVGDSLRNLGRSGMPKSYVGMGDSTFRLLAFWYSDALLIAGALFALAFGAIFGLVYKFSPRLQKGEELQASARWGVTAGLLVAVTAGVVSWASEISGESGIVTIGLPAMLAVTFLGLPILFRLTWRQIGHGLLVLLATLGSLGLIVGAAAIGAFLFGGPLSMITLLQGTAVGGDGDGVDTVRQFWTVLLPTIVASLMLLLPLLMLLLFAICSRIIRVPVSAGVTRGMRAMAVPLAALLLLGWCGSLIATLRHENAALHELKRFVQVGELPMYAEVQGKAIPRL